MMPFRSMLAGLLCLLALSSLDAQNPDHEIREFDRVHKTNGSVQEGVIVTETGAVIKFETKSGIEYNIPKDQVERIVRRNPPERAYQYREKDADDDDFEEQLALGLWCIDPAGLFDKAIIHLVRANRLQPDDPRPYEAVVPLFEQKDDGSKNPTERDVEMGVYMRGQEHGVGGARLPYRAALILTYGGETPGAIYMLETALNSDGIDDEPQMKSAAEALLARLLEAEGRQEESRAIVEKILEAADDEGALQLLGMQAGWLLEDFASGKAEAGVRLKETVDRMLDIDDSHGEAHAIRGYYWMLEGDFDKAKSSFSKAISNGVVNFDVLNSIALNYARSGFFQKAEDALVQTTPSAMDTLQHAVVKAYLLENKGEAEVAAGLMKECLDSPQASWQTWILALQQLARTEELEELESEAKKFLQKFGQNSVAFSECAVLLGDAALRKKDGPAARRWLDYVSMEREPDPELWLRIGQAHLLPGGDRARARKALVTAHEADPESLAIRNSLGYLEYVSGDMDKAREWFDDVVDEFKEEEQELAEPPPPLAFALRGRDQASFVIGEEYWQETFARENGDRIDNKWDEDEKVGVSIDLREGSARFDGTQRFQPDGLTVLNRLIDPNRLTRLRARVRLANGADEIRVALRLEDETGESGLIFFRQPDGALAFAVNSSDESTVVNPPAPPEEGEAAEEKDDDDDDDDDEKGKDPVEEYGMRRVVWENDGEAHWIEIRLGEGKRGKASLYFDGERVARDIRVPVTRRSRSGLRVGVSGQAEDLETRYRFEVTDFELFRLLPEGKERRKR